ncbi:hypothetical protein PROFUN_11870 [Planoprotostelium fungivorum]|uniref:60S acidic ribosomal protein P2 n=1 Tax=Planoprotostelium fungivorum TaxID=1890364 RepID=A0A2P6N9C4_9EUKA|nr:hypothetical protein PROFUN_11870 [Planoprotostelium fungivorum]
MKVVAAYLLAVLGGNATPSESDVTKILSSVGIEADSARVSQLVSELSGKNLEELIAAGASKLASVPSGGAAAAGSAPAAAAPAGGAAPAKEEKKKEEPKEEEDDDMGFGLFD